MAIGNAAKIKGTQPKGFMTVIGQPPNIWKNGYISLVSPDRLPLGAVAVANNIMQRQDGVWGTRWGSANFGPSYTGPITGFTDFTTYSGTTPTNGIMIIDNGVLKYSTNMTSWTTVIGHTYTTTKWSTMLQFENKVIIVNGVDAMSYIDLTTFTYYGFTGISTPATPTATVGSGITGTGYNIYYQVTASTASGETAGSTVVTVPVNLDRGYWWNTSSTGNISTSTNYVTLSWGAVTGAIGYTVYCSDNEAGITYELAQVNGTTYTDYGIDSINNFAQVPTTDTTTAPAFSWIALSDNRLYATGDPNHINRVYFASSQRNNNLAFNAFLGGGWVDILPGGQQIPTYVGQFRTGQGNPMTTILLSDPSGYGTTWNIDLTTDTIGNTVITVPSVSQSLATFGSGAPRSVIQTNQNIYFHSGGPAGIYTTGSVPTLFNVLSTNEISILVRPDLQSIPLGNIPSICGIEFDRKLFYAVGLGSTTNNTIMVYDLEKETWSVNAFTFGVIGFVRFVDSNGNLRLLAIRNSPKAGNYMQDLYNTYTTDNGISIQSELETGLIHLTPDHTQFGFVQYATTEFGPSTGEVDISISGTPYNSPYQELYSEIAYLGNSTVTSGFSSYLYSSMMFSASTFSVSPSALANKQTIRVMKILNNYAIAYSSIGSNTNFVVNQQVMQGNLTPIPPQPSWIIN